MKGLNASCVSRTLSPAGQRWAIGSWEGQVMVPHPIIERCDLGIEEGVRRNDDHDSNNLQHA